jgi:hypothetical protein
LHVEQVPGIRVLLVQLEEGRQLGALSPHQGTVWIGRVVDDWLLVGEVYGKRCDWRVAILSDKEQAGLNHYSSCIL